ncbi:hypothetical protein B0H13DRAFT_1664783 [Mycena leptocephala]|nr:hypothetical protein B0H13DRAFT_1664783 [Mycena leptocephala]
MIVDYLDYQKLHTVDNPEANSDSEPDADTNPVPPPAQSSTTPFFARSAIDSLSGTSASFLTSTSPLKATSIPPAFKALTITPLRPTSRYAELLATPAATAREQELLSALAEADQRDEMRKTAMVGMQAGVLLSGMYVNRAQAQLQEVEERKAKKKTKRKMGDGKAKWFTGDAFIQLCIDDEQRKEEETAGKEDRQVQREECAGELAEWKKENDLIRGRNEAKKEVFEADKAAWEIEKDDAKADKRRPGWAKPKWKDYKPELLLKRPKAPVEDKEEDSDDGEGSANGSEMEID